MEIVGAVLKVTLENVSSFLSILADIAQEVFAVFVGSADYKGVVLVIEPDLWQPIHAADVAPAELVLGNSTLKIVAEHAFAVPWLVFAVLF